MGRWPDLEAVLSLYRTRPWWSGVCFAGRALARLGHRLAAFGFWLERKGYDKKPITEKGPFYYECTYVTSRGLPTESSAGPGAPQPKAGEVSDV